MVPFRKRSDRRICLGHVSKHFCFLQLCLSGWSNQELALFGQPRGVTDQKTKLLPLAAKRVKRSSCDEGSWCSGLTCLPVTEEIAGSNPVEPAKVKDPVSLTGLGLLLWG